MKRHYYTQKFQYSNPGSKIIWYESLCKLAASTDTSNPEKSTCLRCLKILKKITNRTKV